MDYLRLQVVVMVVAVSVWVTSLPTFCKVVHSNSR